MTCNDIKRNKKWLLLWLIPLFFSIFTSLNGYFWVINFIMGFSSIFGLAFIISFIVLSLVEFNWLDCLDLMLFAAIISLIVGVEWRLINLNLSGITLAVFLGVLAAANFIAGIIRKDLKYFLKFINVILLFTCLLGLNFCCEIFASI